MSQLFKILNNIDQIDKKSIFKMSTYEATRGHRYLGSVGFADHYP